MPQKTSTEMPENSWETEVELELDHKRNKTLGLQTNVSGHERNKSGSFETVEPLN